MTTTTFLTAKKQSACRLQSKIDPAEINLDSLSEAFSALPGVSILGGNFSKETADGFSYWMAMPKEAFEFHAGEIKPLEKLQHVLDKYKPTKPPLPNCAFTGGWVGFFGYELGSHLEPAPCTNTDDLRLPLIRLCFYDRLIAYDHKKKSFQLITLELDNDTETPKQKLSFLEALLDKARDVRAARAKTGRY